MATMTATSARPTDTSSRTILRSSSDDRMLRGVLATNAATSTLGGLVALLASSWLDEELLHTGQSGWVRVVGAGLVAFGVAVALVSRSVTDDLPVRALAVSVADAGWVVVTIATILAGWYSTSGAVLVAAVGAMVAVFGVEQAVLAHRLQQ